MGYTTGIEINSKIEFLNKDICHDTKPPIINLSPKKYTFFNYF